MRLRLLLMVLFVTGCHVSQPRPEPNRSSGLHHYPLLPPASFGRSLELEQLLQGRFRDEPFQLRIHIEIEAEQLLVVGLTTVQTRAFALRYDGKSLEFQNYTGRDMPFPAGMILSDIQLVLWPTLPEHQGWHVVDYAATQRRLVFFDDRLVSWIQYNGTSAMQGETLLANMQYGYQLRIRTVTVSAK